MGPTSRMPNAALPPAEALDADVLAARSEFYLTMAQALTAPMTADACTALRRHLADSLEALTAAAGFREGGAIQRLRQALASLADDQDLLVSYSRLFLVPPCPVPLNAGFHLDGALYGPSLEAMDACYRAHGVGRSPDFKDMSDHLVAALEFLSLLYSRAAACAEVRDETRARALATEAAAFVNRFLTPWLPDAALRAQRDRDTDPPSPYADLLHLLSAAAPSGRLQWGPAGGA